MRLDVAISLKGFWEGPDNLQILLLVAPMLVRVPYILYLFFEFHVGVSLFGICPHVVK